MRCFIPFLLGVDHKVVDLGLVGDEVDAPQAGVGVAGVERLETVAQVLGGAALRQLAAEVAAGAHRAVPAADERAGDHERYGVRVAPRRALDAQRHVCQADVVVAHTYLAAGEAARLKRLRLGVRVGLERAEVLLGQLDQLVVVDAAGRGQHHTRRLVVRVDVVTQILGRDRPYRTHTQIQLTKSLRNTTFSLYLYLIFSVGPRMVRPSGVPW